MQAVQQQEAADQFVLAALVEDRAAGLALQRDPSQDPLQGGGVVVQERPDDLDGDPSCAGVGEAPQLVEPRLEPAEALDQSLIVGGGHDGLPGGGWTPNIGACWTWVTLPPPRYI